MSDAIMLFSVVMNVFLMIAVLALIGDRRSLSDQVRWLQQQPAVPGPHAVRKQSRPSATHTLRILCK